MGGRTPLRVGIAGLGAIGKALAVRLDRGIPGVRLAAVAGRSPEPTAQFVATLSKPVATTDIAGLPEFCDVVVECAPPALLMSIVEPVLAAGKKVAVLSVGALLEHIDRVDALCANGGQIIVPTGALLGLDAVSAAAEGTIHSVRMISRKPPIGFRGAPLVVEKNIDLDAVREPLKLYEGSARAAAKDFPANLNVAVALSLAGIGPDRTMLEVWADPGVQRNTHNIQVESDSASFSMTIANIPSENPKTGLITAQSVLAMLRRMTAPLRVGT